MQAGPDARGEGKTLAERLAETRAASNRQLEEDQPSLCDNPEAVEELDAEEIAENTDAIVQAAKAAKAAGGVSAKSSRKVCLVVDDSRVIRKLISKVAMSLGYQVIDAENGEEALARCRKRMPDLILTDWNMPVMSGLDFVTQLRAMEADKEPTVMFCTSKGQVEDIHEGIQAGADDYIVKPFAEDALKSKLVKLGVA